MFNDLEHAGHDLLPHDGGQGLGLLSDAQVLRESLDLLLQELEGACAFNTEPAESDTCLVQLFGQRGLTELAVARAQHQQASVCGIEEGFQHCLLELLSSLWAYVRLVVRILLKDGS